MPAQDHGQPPSKEMGSTDQFVQSQQPEVHATHPVAELREPKALRANPLDISGAGQLPTLDTYLQDLLHNKASSSVTQYLSESLYKHNEPPEVRFNVHAVACDVRACVYVL